MDLNGTFLKQSSYQVNLEVIVMWVDNKLLHENYICRYDLDT